MASKTTLKPCPFCGGIPEISVIPNPGGFVACVRCYHSSWMTAGNEVSVFSQTWPARDEARAEAVAAWNRRAEEEAAMTDSIMKDESVSTSNGHGDGVSLLPWRLRLDENGPEFTDCPIIDANGDPVVQTDAGCYPPNNKTAALIVEAVNERDRLNKEILDLKCERAELWENIDRYEAERMELCHKIGRREKELSETTKERDSLRDLVRRLADIVRHDCDARAMSLTREAYDALGEEVPE